MQEYDTHTYIGHDLYAVIDWCQHSASKHGQRVALVVDPRCTPEAMYGNDFTNELHVHPKDYTWLMKQADQIWLQAQHSLLYRKNYYG